VDGIGIQKKSHIRIFANGGFSRMKGLFRSRVLPFLAFIALFSFSSLAQSNSGVTGVVADSQGALVPGAKVVLFDTKTSRELSSTTNDNGIYVFNNVPPGTGYRLTFTAPNFQTLVLNDIALGISRTETHDVRLTAGQVSETVTVTTQAGEATLNTTDASVGNVINERQIRELPIQLRDNPAALLGLQPGVIGDNVGTGNVNRVGSVTGARADQSNITVDGIDSNDVTTGQAFVTVGNLPIDSVQEFRATTANPGANQGRSSGGQIELGTKPGTNEFHGSLREYYRGANFAANTFFNNRNGVARPALQRHQFGGSLGGPLPFPNFGEGGPVFNSGRDRLFFFFDYEGRRDNSELSTSRTVPLQHFREGRIGYILATSTATGAACPTNARLDTRPDCIGFLTPAQIAARDPQGVGFNPGLLSFINERYPLANDLSGGNGINTGLFRFNAPVLLSNNTYTTRIDANVNENQRMFGRLTITRNSQTNALQQFPGDEDAQRLDDKSYQFVVGHTWVVSPSVTNQATVGVSRQQWFFPIPETPSFPAVVSFGVITSPYPTGAYQDRDVSVPTFRDDLTWTKGNHTFQFGGSYKPIRQNTTLTNDTDFPGVGLGGGLTALNSTFRPTNILAGAVTNYDAAFTFALGRLASQGTRYVYDPSGAPLPLGTGRIRHWVYDETELFAQDNWRIRPNLTLTLGLRWQLYPAPYEKDGFQTGTDVSLNELFDARVANAAAGVSGNTSEPLLTYTLAGKANDGLPMYKTDWDNFSPRIGFNYNPSFTSGILGTIFGERKTAIRGGYSLVYDRPGGAISFLVDQNSYIFDRSVSLNFGSATDISGSLLNDPRFIAISNFPVRTVPPVVTNPITPNLNAAGRPIGLANPSSNYLADPDFEIPYSHQWSFGIQREIPGNMILDVSYVGRRGKKLFALADAAQVVNFEDPASGQLLFDALNAIQPQVQANIAAGLPATTGLTPQPWLENQMLAGIQGLRLPTQSCQSFIGPTGNCTQLAVALFPDLVKDGGTADFIQQLYFNRLLLPNVGMSAQFARNTYVSNLGDSQYDGLLVSLRKRFSKGFQFDVNYTWSHAIDNSSSVFNVSNSDNTGSSYVCDLTNLNACRGDADFDIRHLMNINGIWEIPVGRGRAFGTDMPGWLDAIIGGWNVAGIFTARSGLPAKSLSGAFPVVFSAEGQAVIVGGTNPSIFQASIHDEGTGIQYFADKDAVLAALRFPRHGENGNRNTFRSEGYWKLDTVVSKKFRMPWSEGHMLTFRAEAYNVTNTNFFAPPALDISDPNNFGRITASQSAPRVIQFALRYDW
jgi:Carboxypeptidase regulatory-like domain